MSTSIPVVDDSTVDREIVSLACESLDCEVDMASNADEAIRLHGDKQHDLILTDYQMAPTNGIDLVLTLKETNPEVVCVVMTAHVDSTLSNFVVQHWLPLVIHKPIRPVNLRDRLRVLLRRHRGATATVSSVALSNRMDQCVALLGQSPEICSVRKRVREVVKSDLPLLIEGAPGIGKPQIAEFIHKNGPYGDSQYLYCDCSQLEPHECERKLIAEDGTHGTLLKEAWHGTLALSNVHLLPAVIQVELAKAFPEIIRETHLLCLLDKPLDEIMGDGLLDDMLYFRLSLESVHISDLSARAVDVDEMVRFVASNPERFELSRKPQPIEVDALVAYMRKTYLERNVEELIERVREYCA